jgi:hypothetical protein
MQAVEILKNTKVFKNTLLVLWGREVDNGEVRRKIVEYQLHKNVILGGFNDQMDIFWRLIYALPDDASSFVFVSPSLQNVNYELLKKLSVVDSDVYFIDDTVDYTFGKKISYCAFKMIRNSHAYACFKTMEFAFSHKEDFSKFVYAPDRLNITDEIQYIFSHSIIDDTTMILNKRELCLL